MIRSVQASFILMMVLANVKSFAHPEYAEKMKMLKQQLSFIHRYENFIGKLDKTISYSVFHFKSMQRPEKKAAMVISPGRTEPSIKYLEVAYDFMKLGYYPIYVIDHRGQGRSQGLMFSDPSNPATRRGHADDFVYFLKDFRQFVNIVKSVEKGPLVLLTHSMGGAIGAHYLKRDSKDFVAASLISPMIGLPDESNKWAVSATMCSLPLKKVQCTEYVKDGEDYFGHDWSPEKDNNFLDGKVNDVTHHQARYEEMMSIFVQDPQLRLGSPTWGWLHQMIRAMMRLRGKKNVKSIQLPFLVVRAGDEKIVNKNSMDNEFCHYSKLCQIKTIAGAYHEILFELDAYRDQAIKWTDEHFSRYLSKK